MEYKVDEPACKFDFTFDDDDKPTIVDAWIDILPGGTLEARTRAAEKAIERATGKELRLRCRFAAGSDYRFEVLD